MISQLLNLCTVIQREWERHRREEGKAQNRGKEEKQRAEGETEGQLGVGELREETARHGGLSLLLLPLRNIKKGEAG